MSEPLNRALAFLLLTALALVWGGNLMRVRGSGGIFYSKHENLLLAGFTRALIAASIAGLVCYLIEPERMRWSHLPLPGWIRACGLLLGGVGVGVLRWVFAMLGRAFSMSLVVKPGQPLVTSGPYRWVRHPMYTAFSMIFLGLFLLSANWFMGATAMLAFGAVMVLRTPQEERMLLAKFGEEYAAYMSRTGRFLPKASA